MTERTVFHRFDAAGRYQGWVVQDQPTDRYEARIGVDLCIQAPPPPGVGQWPYRVDGQWVLVVDPLLDPPAP